MFVDEWRNDGFVALDEEFEAGDLVAVGRTALLTKVGSPAQRIYASQLISFAFDIEVGDMVVVPQLPKRRSYLVGEVVGGHEHVSPYPPSGPHRRRVRWLGDFDRERLSPEAARTLGFPQALSRPSTSESELRELITAL
jgi:predicted Mrr-cat superfamily restriction endonuclease